MANPIFKLNGSVVNPVQDWSALQVLGTWSEMGGAANISVEELTFVNENAELIRQHIADGLTGGLGIFEGIPFNIEMSNGTTIDIFEGILDLTAYKEINPTKVETKIKKINGIDQLMDRANGITWAFLYEEGVITDSDFSLIPYIKEKPFKESAAELALLTLCIFLFVKQLQDSIKSIGEKLGINLPAHAIGGISGPAAAAQYSFATIVIEAIYTAFIVVQLINLIKDIIEILYPLLRGWRGCNVKNFMQIGLNYLGYNYVSSIDELSNLYILPSKNDEGTRYKGNFDTVGYPDSGDFGYTIGEMITLINRMFSARVKIVGSTMYQEPLINDNFWIGQSQYTLPDIENEVVEYNTDEISTRHLIRYQTDTQDDWTFLEYEGTAYEVLVTPITTQDQKRVLIKGFKDTEIPYALGDKKDGLNPIESFVEILAIAMDSCINFFGGNSNRAADIKSRRKMLHVTGDSLSVGKLLYLTLDQETGRLLMNNDRFKIEAKTLWDKYISESSFVSHNFRGQKRLFNELKIPFGFSDFIALLNNSYCTDISGNVIKIETLKWAFDSDYAIVSGWQRKPYTYNLKENYFNGLENQV